MYARHDISVANNRHDGTRGMPDTMKSALRSAFILRGAAVNRPFVNNEDKILIGTAGYHSAKALKRVAAERAAKEKEEGR